MSSSHDVTESLASIVSAQNRTHRKTLIFVDEINAEIQGSLIMGLLLGPISDGQFVLDGKRYRIDPAAWVFASTAGIEALQKDSKGSDFGSRLNGPIIDLDTLSAGEELRDIIGRLRVKINRTIGKSAEEYEALIYGNDTDEENVFNSYSREEGLGIKTEQVYLMTTFLADRWGPISHIRKNVIQLFHDMLPLNGIRSLSYFATCFDQIVRGEVSTGNVPDLRQDPALRRHIIVPRNWYEQDLKDVVTESGAPGAPGTGWVRIDTRPSPL